MSATVSYKGATIATVSNDTKTLLTEGKYLEDDLTLTDVSGGGAVLTTKNISANGTYNASSDSADGYSQVNVAVPNSYSAGDEGKVVSNGALVAQTAHADVTPTTSDQTIDTTTNNSIKVKGDADLVASNIKKDVEIFGVTGSYEGGGGGTPVIGLVDEIEITSPVATISYTLPQLAKEYGRVWLYFDNVTLSNSDYVYFSVVDSATSLTDNNGFYNSPTPINSNCFCVFTPTQTIDGIEFNGFAGAAWEKNAQPNNNRNVKQTDPSVLKGKLYQAANRFTGGTIKIYGRTA